MIMLVEAQARYTYAILPFYTILAAIGLRECNKMIRKKIIIKVKLMLCLFAFNN